MLTKELVSTASTTILQIIQVLIQNLIKLWISGQFACFAQFGAVNIVGNVSRIIRHGQYSKQREKKRLSVDLVTFDELAQRKLLEIV